MGEANQGPKSPRLYTYYRTLPANTKIVLLSAFIFAILFLVSITKYLPSPHYTHHLRRPVEISTQSSKEATSTLKLCGKHPGITYRHVRKTPLPPFTKEWAKLLHFVPEEESQNCLNLFKTESSRDINVTNEMHHLRAAISREVHKNALTPEHEKLTLTYQELARQDFVHTVCEIGFNVGQSAAIWLSTKPNLELYTFDMGVLSPEFTMHMGRVLKKMYPKRFNYIVGDSRITVPEWAKLGKKCDIVSIDGGHEYEVVFPDIINMKQIAAKKHIIVLDDIYYNGVNTAWTELTKAGYVHHLFDCRIKGKDVDFALGYYKDFKIETIQV